MTVKRQRDFKIILITQKKKQCKKVLQNLYLCCKGHSCICFYYYYFIFLIFCIEEDQRKDKKEKCDFFSRMNVAALMSMTHAVLAGDNYKTGQVSNG